MANTLMKVTPTVGWRGHTPGVAIDVDPDEPEVAAMLERGLLLQVMEPGTIESEEAVTLDPTEERTHERHTAGPDDGDRDPAPWAGGTGGA